MGLLDAFNDPQTMGLLSAAAGMLERSGPSTRPVSFGQVASSGLLGGMRGVQAVQDQQKERMQMDMLKQQISQATRKNNLINDMLEQYKGSGTSIGGASSALADGAKLGDIGPTNTNAARMPTQQASNPLAGISREAIAHDLAFNEGKNLSEWMFKRTTPEMNVSNGYAYDKNSIKPGFLPQLNVSQDGKTSMVTIGPDGHPFISAPQGAVKTFADYQDTQKAADARYTPLDPDKYAGTDGRPVGGSVLNYINQTKTPSQGAQGLDTSRLTPEQQAYLQQQDPEAFNRGVANFAYTGPSKPAGLQSAAEREAAVGKARADNAAYEKKLKDDEERLSKSKRSYEQLKSAIPMARNLLQNATGSGAGAMVDSALNFFGKSTESSEAAKQLELLSGWMTSNVPRMEGPQGVQDVLLYQTMAAQVGDRTLPSATRLKALGTLETLQNKYAETNKVIPPGSSNQPKSWQDHGYSDQQSVIRDAQNAILKTPRRKRKLSSVSKPQASQTTGLNNMGMFDDLAVPQKGGATGMFADLLPEKSKLDHASDVAKGAASGFADLGDVLLNVGAYLPGKALPSVKKWNDERSASLKNFNADNADSTAFNVGRIGGNVAATWPVGGVLGAGVRAVSAAPKVQALGNAIASGGFRTGLDLAGAPFLSRVGDMGLRTVGGGVAGGASTALVSPDDAGMGATIGAVLPPAFKTFTAGTNALGRGIRSIRTPQEAKAAKVVLDAAEATSPQAISAIRNALTQQGPSLLPPDAALTVPQILQMPGVSQLQRTVKAAGDTTLTHREAAQNAASMQGLNRISPVSGTVQQAAENLGNQLERVVLPAEKEAGANVRKLYESVDPFDESRFFLPIQKMQAARDKFLGPGTFGTGRAVEEAISTAKAIGTETVDAVKPLSAQKAQDLVLAVRAAGGINTSSKSGRELSGEIRNLRESGLNNIVRPNTGLSVERMAEQMQEAGFLPDADPSTLLNLLHESAAGNKIYANSADNVYRHAMEMAQGPPPAGGTFNKTVPFRELQNLRSSIGEAAQGATEKGRNKEAAALRQMIADLDTGVDHVARGVGDPAENFPADIVKAWRDANAAHEAKQFRFRTGPQASMFRNGADGQRSAQGAELAGKFFNATRSQADDAKAYKRLVDNNPDLMAALKNYGITDLANQTDRLGTLTNSKFGSWLDGRSGAVREAFNDQERAIMRQIGNNLNASDLGENLGRSSGSNTVQNAQNALGLGLLDSPLVNVLANKIPVLNAVSGPMLTSLRETAKKSKAQQLGGLLADPAALDAAIGRYFQLQQPGRLTGLLEGATMPALPMLYRGAPVTGLLSPYADQR